MSNYQELHDQMQATFTEKRSHEKTELDTVLWPALQNFFLMLQVYNHGREFLYVYITSSTQKTYRIFANVEHVYSKECPFTIIKRGDEEEQDYQRNSYKELSSVPLKNLDCKGEDVCALLLKEIAGIHGYEGEMAKVIAKDPKYSGKLPKVFRVRMKFTED